MEVEAERGALRGLAFGDVGLRVGGPHVLFVGLDDDELVDGGLPRLDFLAGHRGVELRGEADHDGLIRSERSLMNILGERIVLGRFDTGLAFRVLILVRDVEHERGVSGWQVRQIHTILGLPLGDRLVLVTAGNQVVAGLVRGERRGGELHSLLGQFDGLARGGILLSLFGLFAGHTTVDGAIHGKRDLVVFRFLAFALTVLGVQPVLGVDLAVTVHVGHAQRDLITDDAALFKVDDIGLVGCLSGTDLHARTLGAIGTGHRALIILVSVAHTRLDGRLHVAHMLSGFRFQHVVRPVVVRGQVLLHVGVLHVGRDLPHPRVPAGVRQARRSGSRVRLHEVGVHGDGGGVHMIGGAVLVAGDGRGRGLHPILDGRLAFDRLFREVVEGAGALDGRAFNPVATGRVHMPGQIIFGRMPVFDAMIGLVGFDGRLEVVQHLELDVLRHGLGIGSCHQVLVRRGQFGGLRNLVIKNRHNLAIAGCGPRDMLRRIRGGAADRVLAGLVEHGRALQGRGVRDS